MTTRKLSQDAQDARDQLRALLPPGTTVRTSTVHTSRSGMYRAIVPYVMTTASSGESYPRDLTWLIVRADIGRTRAPRHEGVASHGAGMDMGFHLVYTLSRALYPDGFGCTGHPYSERRPLARRSLYGWPVHPKPSGYRARESV